MSNILSKTRYAELFKDKSKLRKFIFKTIIEFIMILGGAFIAAFAVEDILVPCKIMDGGIVGVSIIISTLSGFPLSILTFLLNIPFLIIGTIKLGKTFLVKASFAMLAFSLSLDFFTKYINIDLTNESLLAVVFGGVILGAGVGLVIRYGGCLDGTEIVALMLNKKFNLPVGQVVLVFNVIIYGTAGMLFGLDRAMFSLLTYFVTSKVLDFVESGIEQAKAAIIITDNPEWIAEQLHVRLGRTVTIMEGEGRFSGKKSVLYCVLTRLEINELRNIVHELDSSAFVAISDVSEIIGNHIKKKKDN
ncbi:MAG: YitT family protein [Lachnospiraceae bacterium]|nr:YitT family protein [Candidatus Merdinaster equi]